MSRQIAFALSLVLASALAAPLARAACAGTDLMANLAVEAPDTHAGILARGREAENGTGKFWRVTRDGAAPSFLFGTVHSTTAAEAGLAPAAARALAEARLVMVEIAPEENARIERLMLEDPAFMLAADPTPFSQRFGPDALPMVTEGLESRGLPPIIAERMKPWILLSTMAVPLCEQREIESGKPLLDEAIAAEAEGAGTPVRGLETIEDVIAAFASLGPGALDRLLLESIAALPHEEDLRVTLERLYREDQIAAIMEFTIWFSEAEGLTDDSRGSAEAIDRALLVRRNRDWLPALAAEMRRGGVFAAVGALHLPGESGLVRLLRDRGFTVERVSE